MQLIRKHRFFLAVLSLALVLTLVAPSLQAPAATFYSDPQTGHVENAGTRASPWPCLQKMIETKLLQRLQPGDRLLLRSGYHGIARFSGENEQVITIAAEQGQAPTLGRLDLRSGTRWTIRGLSISPEHGGLHYHGAIVSLGEYGPSSELILEDCSIFATSHSEKLNAAEWISLNNGIFLGRNGSRLISRNNYVFNTRHAIQSAATDSIVEGCVVENFSGDAIRLTRSGCIARWNIARNAYCDEKHDGDRNHDDLLQCFRFGKGSGVLKKIRIEENLLIGHSNPNQPFPGQVQGIGLFDGPLVNFTVTGNVISVDHWHGLTLVDAQNCTISQNVVWSLKLETSKFRPWIMLGSKKHLAKGNRVTENFACSFHLDQPGTEAFANQMSNQAVFEQAKKKLQGKIIEKFGVIHPVARRSRLTGKRKKEL